MVQYQSMIHSRELLATSITELLLDANIVQAYGLTLCHYTEWASPLVPREPCYLLAHELLLAGKCDRVDSSSSPLHFGGAPNLYANETFARVAQCKEYSVGAFAQ